jgi:hypothetical protein
MKVLLSDSIIRCQGKKRNHLCRSSRELCNFYVVRPVKWYSLTLAKPA